MRTGAFALALALVCGPAAGARFERPAPPTGPSVIEHAFPEAGAAFRLEMRRVPGELHRLPGRDGRLADFADYTGAGRLTVGGTLALGPLPDGEGPALVPPGEYELSLSVSGPEGLPVLRLVSETGLRLRLPMPAAPRPAGRRTALEAESFAAGGEAVSVPVAIHLPTVSGLILLGPAELLDESPLKRRRSRTQVIQEEMQRRALESGHVRSLERRRARPSGK